MTSRFLAALFATVSITASTASAETKPLKALSSKALSSKDGPREVAILGAGCFWGVEHWMMKAPGVLDAEVGYIGGTSASVSYEQVGTGTTGHAEVVRIVFDPSVISYEALLSKWFFKIHDPTTKDRQGNDAGPQYRSAIFPTSDAQRKVAEQITARVQKSGAWKAPLTTTIEAPTNWVKAEGYHQDYLVKHPGGYDNHYFRDLKF